jgi:hypothetical protein
MDLCEFMKEKYEACHVQTWEESKRVCKFEENERAVMHRNEMKGCIELRREDKRDAMLRSVIK